MFIRRGCAYETDGQMIRYGKSYIPPYNFFCMGIKKLEQVKVTKVTICIVCSELIHTIERL